MQDTSFFATLLFSVHKTTVKELRKMQLNLVEFSQILVKCSVKGSSRGVTVCEKVV